MTRLARLPIALALASLSPGWPPSPGPPTPGSSTRGATGPGKGKNVVLISGDEEYRSEEALPQLAKILAKRHGFTCTVLFADRPGRDDRPEPVRQHPRAWRPSARPT